MKQKTPAATRTNAEMSEQTTGDLVRYARRAFAKKGYDGVSLEHIAEEASLTKGAAYYHFKSKRGLFEAVFHDVEREIVERIERRAFAAAEPLEALRAGCEGFIDIALDDELRQIALVDAPRVLGWARWRAIDGEFGLGSLKEGLRVCKAAGVLKVSDLDVLAHMLSGAMNEAVFLIAEADKPRRVHRAVTRQLHGLLSALTG